MMVKKRVVFFTGFSTGFGLLALLLAGVLSWPLVRGVPGMLIGIVGATLGAAILKIIFHESPSVTAAGLGAVLASYVALATAEVVPAGSLEWALKGGLFGAAIGVSLAMLLSMLKIFLVGFLQLETAGANVVER